MSSVAVESVSEKIDSHYRLRCLTSGEELNDHRSDRGDEFPLTSSAAPGFLRSEYRQRRFSPDLRRNDIYRYAAWLPVVRFLDGAGGPVTFRSTAYGPAIGLNNLYITFSGWWPERGGRIPTGTFKENEAYAVYGRMGDAAHRHTLVVASAGNTARAFLRVATENELPLVIVIPEKNLPDLWTVGPRSASTVVIAAGNGADYSDAIHLASLLTGADGFLPEGGAKNVARRDGMGTTYLSAAETIAALPDHYFQAVGSGTGAIAAWEANLRLLDADFPVAVPSPVRENRGRTRLHLAQNAPFQLLVDTWADGTRELRALDTDVAKQQIDAISAKVLANRRPPWSPTGGLYDALSDTNGEMYAVTNAEALDAGARFERAEGIDLAPAARVACGALEAAVRRGTVAPDDTISLNITGGGYARARRDLPTLPLTADTVVDIQTQTTESIAETVRRIQKER